MVQYPENTSIVAPLPANPAPRAHHHGRYTALMDMMKTTDDWVCCVDLDLIAGQGTKGKISALHSAAFNRKMKIQSTVQHGFIYVKLVKSEVV